MNEDTICFANTGQRLPLYVTMAGITNPDSSYRIQRDCSDTVVLEYVLSGLGYITVGDAYVTVGQDQVYLLREGERHNYYADPEQPYEKIFLNVSGMLAMELIGAYQLKERYVFPGGGTKPLFEEVLRLVHTSGSEEERQLRLCGLYVEILGRLRLDAAQEKHTPEAQQLKRYMDERLAEMVSAQELAQQLYRSPDYCQKLFKREYGVTPYEYQLRRKMRAACRLLSSTMLPVGEIGLRLGYEDAQYFSNLFRKKVGCSPREYRKREYSHG